jgi:eukaryotic translation initiation factor 2C
LRRFVFVFGYERFFPLVDAQNSMLGFIKGLRSVGMGVKEDHPRIFYVPQNIAPGRISEYFKTMIKGTGLSGPPSLIVCYLDRKPSVEYAMIKRFGDIETGVATQVSCEPQSKAE